MQSCNENDSHASELNKQLKNNENYITNNDEQKNQQQHKQEDKFIGLLSEDHPLLEKFQKSLNEHLLRIQAQLQDDIQELDCTIKAKEQEREEVGSKLYDLQHEIQRQNSILDDFTKQIKSTSEQRVTKENHIAVLRKDYEKQLELNKEAKNYHKKRIMELTSLQALEMNIQKWSKEIDNEVAEAQRIVNKDNQNQKLIAEEKRKTDLLLFNLNSEVRKREQELESINEEIKEQGNLLEILNTSLSDANADLEAIQKEQKRLTQAWNEVIIAINRRDKILMQVKENLMNEIEKQKTSAAAIEITKRAITKEMEQNEKLEIFKIRILEDLKNIKKQDDRELDIVSKLQSKLNQLETIIQQTELDLKAAKQEGNSLTIQYRSIQSKVDKEILQKQKLEDEIFKFHEDQVTADNGCIYRLKILKDLQNQRRHIEENITIVEKQLSNMIYELEKLKANILKLQEENVKLQQIQCGLNDRIAKYEEEIKDSTKDIQTKQKTLDIYRKKLEEAIDAAGGKEMSTTEVTISELERKISDINKEIQKAQQYWLTQQRKLVNLSEKRSAQINEIRLIQKYIMILEHESLKVNEILNEKIATGQEIERDMKTLMTKLNLLGTKLFEKKKLHEQDEEECHHVHLEFIDKLKDAEMATLKLEQEISDITKEIEQLKEIVLERHRESLSWETKYKMAEEMARWRNEEKSNDSDIGHMKMEIRRMEVRYNQLKRAQNKLINDLENCIVHREKIFMTAMCRQKADAIDTTAHATNNLNNSADTTVVAKYRSAVQHKINELKSKIKQIQNEINSNEKHLNEITNKYEEIVNQIEQKKNELDNEKLQDNLIQNEIEQGLLLKYQNLEIIIKKQHRAKRLHALETYRVLPKNKNELTLINEEKKQKEINENLVNIIQTLLTDYPEKKFFLTRILQTLQED